MLHPMLAFFASISCSTTSRPPFLALVFLRPLPTSALLSVPLSFPASVRAHVALLVRGPVAALLSPPPRSLLHHLPPPPTRARARIHLTTCPRSLLPSPPPLPTHTSVPFPHAHHLIIHVCVAFSLFSIRWSFLHVFLLNRISFVRPAYPPCHCYIHYSVACVSPMLVHDHLCCILSHSDAPRTDLAV